MSTNTRKNSALPLRVTFSNEDANDESQFQSEFNRLKASIDSKLQVIHEKYHVKTLYNTVALLWQQHSVIVSGKSFFIYCPTSGLWTELSPRKALQLTIEMLLDQQTKDYEAVCKKFEKVFQRYTKNEFFGRIIDGINEHIQNVVGYHDAVLHGFSTGYHFEAETFEQARELSNDPEFEKKLDTAKDVVAMSNLVYRVKFGHHISFTLALSDEEKKELRLSRSLPLLLPPTLSQRKLLDPLSHHLQTVVSLICEAIFANRIPKQTFVQLVGDGAAAFAQRISELCGDEICCTTTLENFDRRKRSTKKPQPGQRLAIFPDGSSVSALTICNNLRWLYKVPDLPLPIVVVGDGESHSLANQLPLNPGPSWKVALVKSDAVLKKASKLSNEDFCAWLIENYNPKYDQPKIAADAVKECIDEIVGKTLEELAWKPALKSDSGTSSTTKSKLSVLSKAVKKHALHLNGSFQRAISQSLLAGLLEKRGFTVTNPQGVLCVLHSSS